MKKLALIFGLLCAGSLHAQCTGGGTITLAASPSESTIAACLSSVNVDGTVIVIPAGSTTFSTQMTATLHKSMTIQCAGNTTGSDSLGNPTGYNDQTYFIQGFGGGAGILPTPTAGKSIRVTGCTLEGDGTSVDSSGFFNLSGSMQSTPCSGSSGACMRFDHNHMTGFKTQNVIVLFGGWIYGVVDHNLFDTGTNGAGSVANGVRVSMPNYGGYQNANGSWYIASNWGGWDKIYFENNTFNYAFANDCTFGGRQVFRYNTFNYALIQTHETGDPLGCRETEVYKNKFTGGSPSTNNVELYARMGTGLSWGNTLSGVGTAIEFHDDRSECNTQSHPQTPPPGGLGYPGNTCWAGTVNTSGTSVTFSSGVNFAGPGTGSGIPQSTTPIVINGVQYAISAYNSSTSLTLSTSAGTQTGVNYYIPSNWDFAPASSSGYPVYGQFGYGSGDLLQGTTFGKNLCNTQFPVGSTDCANGLYTGRWPHLDLEPTYEWLNSYTGLSHIYNVGTGSNAALWTECQDYYTYSASFTGACSTGNGIGSGLLSARPSTCTPLTAYWATDTNTLYQCATTNTWSTYYTPAAYPHPLVSSSAATPTLNPGAGTYVGSQTVTISSTSGTVLCWNTGGSPATAGNGSSCTTGTAITTNSGTNCVSSHTVCGDITVSTTETVYAVAGSATLADSSIASAAYVINVSSISHKVLGTVQVEGTVVVE